MQLAGLSVGIIADDLTGACDTALQFFSSHCETHVLLDFQRLHHNSTDSTLSDWGSSSPNQVISMNTCTRHTSPQEAQAIVREAVALCREHYGVENFYKKIDSTLRGNIASECLGILEEIQAKCAVIVPAYPREGRRTVGGYQLVRGIPVEKTVIARDPLYPIRQSHLPTLLAKNVEPLGIVGYIPLSLVLHGAGPILSKLNELIKEGKKLVVIDATTDEDLEQIALAIDRVQKYAAVLPCGSGGLAQALADLWAIEPNPETDLENSDLSKKSVSPQKCLPHPQKLPAVSVSPILIVSGSNTDTTRNQMFYLRENYSFYGQGSQIEIVEPSPEQLLGLTSVDSLIHHLLSLMESRNTVILSSTYKEEAYLQTMALAREHQLSDLQASQRVQETLGRITAEVCRSQPVKLVLIGGETTYEVCSALHIEELEIIAQVETSIPLTINPEGQWIVTKSGGFGLSPALANIVQQIKQWEIVFTHAS